MPSGDTFGALTFPIEQTYSSGTPAGDPALGHLAAFLKAAVNADCGELWEEISPNRQAAQSPVLFTFTRDPRRLFEENRLPALYVWRGKSTRARVADELWKRTTKIQLTWIFEPRSEDHMTQCGPFVNAIANAIDNAITGDRHPAWSVTGDTDPLSETRGSSMSAACGFSRAQPTGDEPQELLFQRVDDAQPLPYYGINLEIEVDEYEQKGATGAPAKLNATLTTNDGTSTKAVEDVPDAS